tara:strand:+ start:184 stop:489 length:306 start_codon:yes stop_codon:yes gene_type:complete
MSSSDLKPRLFQVMISGKSVTYDASGVDSESDHFVSSLQVVIDLFDLDNFIEVMKEEFTEVHDVKTSELHIGFSPLFHEVIIEGCKVMKISPQSLPPIFPS